MITTHIIISKILNMYITGFMFIKNISLIIVLAIRTIRSSIENIGTFQGVIGTHFIFSKNPLAILL
jgi:hypothetical protein